jgi:hypothetical protein
LRARLVQHNHIKRHLPPVLLMRLGRLNRSKMLQLPGRKRLFRGHSLINLRPLRGLLAHLALPSRFRTLLRRVHRRPFKLGNLIKI